MLDGAGAVDEGIPSVNGQSARDKGSRMLRTGVIIIGCVYLLGAVAFAVVICIDYWEAGWSLYKGLSSGIERALLWPVRPIRQLT